MSGLLHSVLALVCLLPPVLLGLRAHPGRDKAFWGAVFLAMIGPGILSLDLLWAHWVTGFAPALWVSLTATTVAFALAAATLSSAWRLLPLLSPYLVVLGLIATIWQNAVGHELIQTLPKTWLGLHIFVGVTTYALLTLAAIAGLAAFFQERALKQKKRTRLAGQLPSVTDSEHLSTRLLMLCESVLGVGLASGVIVEKMELGQLLVVEYKTVLSISAFAIIGILLIAIRFAGVRGRLAARLILLAWLLLTLAYPGVKFVTDVLIV